MVIFNSYVSLPEGTPNGPPNHPKLPDHLSLETYGKPPWDDGLPRQFTSSFQGTLGGQDEWTV